MIRQAAEGAHGGARPRLRRGEGAADCAPGRGRSLTPRAAGTSGEIPPSTPRSRAGLVLDRLCRTGRRSRSTSSERGASLARSSSCGVRQSPWPRRPHQPRLRRLSSRGLSRGRRTPPGVRPWAGLGPLVPPRPGRQVLDARRDALPSPAPPALADLRGARPAVLVQGARARGGSTPRRGSVRERRARPRGEARRAGSGENGRHACGAPRRSAAITSVRSCARSAIGGQSATSPRRGDAAPRLFGPGSAGRNHRCSFGRSRE